MKAKLAQFVMLKGVQRLLSPVDRTEFSMSPAVVNAQYVPETNGIFLYAALLQPYFELALPSFYTYATIGSFVGHEITHGFDNMGAQYDKVGNLKSWWDNATLARFTARTQCVVDEYSRFIVDGIGMNVNGRLTLGENVADNGALKASFRAFKALKTPASYSTALTGLGRYTPQQLFFMSYGQLWCTSSRPDAARRQILIDPHSPGKFRVNGAVVNSPEFAAAFNCPLGSPMNPRNKCTVW
ncbi:neprilysin [Aphelenchoides avenae]|nr:neprilysin [Aphelenchus avenae]